MAVATEIGVMGMARRLQGVTAVQPAVVAAATVLHVRYRRCLPR